MIKENNIMKTVCIYHSIDLDGWMSAAIVKHWHMNYLHSIVNKIEKVNTLDFIGYNYGQPIPDLSEYDKVIMCDISFSNKGGVAQEMIDLFGMNTLTDKRFIWIDHHDSSINLYYKNTIDYFIHGSLNVHYAACELTWMYFFPDEPIPEIVRLLGRYDCFGHKGTDEEQKVLEFQYGARQVITNYEEAYEWLIKCTKDIKGIFPNTELHHQIIWVNGKTIYKYLCTEAKQVYKNGFEIKLWIDSIPTDEEIRPIPAIGVCDVCGKEEHKQLIRYYFRYENDKCNCHSPYHFDLFDCCQTCKPVAKNKVPKRFICINKERFNPINFGIDYHADGYDGVACFWYANNKWNFSLYNDNGEVDCSAIAKQFGGGGHKGAAGFIVKDLQEILF